MLRGTVANDSLDGLAASAGRTVELIGRILNGEEFWRFQAENV
ncbi:MAG: hypothetical protein ABMA01_16970 [Chthoniobacteraceae bacterium]